MRHLSRTHRVSVAWLHEQYERGDSTFTYVRSCQMAADVFTKSIPNPDGWFAARRKINVFSGIGELSEIALGVPVAPSVVSACYGAIACVAVSVQAAEVTPRPHGAVVEVTPRRALGGLTPPSHCPPWGCILKGAHL